MIPMKSFQARLWLVSFCIALFTSPLFAQKKSTTFGIQLKPFIPVSFIKTGVKNEVQDTMSLDITLESGFSGGMIIRRNFTKLIALEGGISYVKRKYSILLTGPSSSEKSEFRIIGYEI